MIDIPISKGDLLKEAATSEIEKTLDRGIAALSAGNRIEAAGAFAQAAAVATAYALGVTYGLTVAYPVAGLSNALRALSQSPGLMGKILIKSGLVSDPLVVIRLGNVADSFAMGAAAAWLTNKFIDSMNSLPIGSKIYDWIHPDPFINERWRDAANWQPPRDPLAIDLDGDGIETLGITKTPILFDHDADGIRTGTGWLSGDDGWLVLDRNGDGHIDSGRELFGEDTLITDADGHARHARSGLRVRGSRAAQNC